MIPTLFGFLLLIVGVVLLLRGDVMTMLALMMVCSLFGGSAAIILTAIGGSSIPPNQFALLFAGLRVTLPGGGQIGRLKEAFRENRFLLIYVVYGVFAAFVFSRIFAGRMEIVPLRITRASRYLFETAPLAFSSQNITVSVYLIGTLLAAVLAYVAMQAKDAPSRFVRTAVTVAWIHIFLGVSAAVLKGTPYDLFIDIVRNANYSQTDQAVGSYVRITGVMPEPSVFATFAFGWFVFLFECWLRGLHSRCTGPAALALGLILMLSTSSTAYVALAIYATLMVARLMLFPHGIGFSRLAILAAVLLGVMTLVALLAVLVPQLIDTAWKILLSMTVEKQVSSSGLQRAFWARVGLDAFFVSHGLGIGPGSFRSSTILTAILGSVGVIGSWAIVAHVLTVLKPLRASTVSGADGIRYFGFDAMVGAAASWGMVGTLVPAILLSPTCDPGMDFAVFCGVALALRRYDRSETAAGDDKRPRWPTDAARLRAPNSSSSFRRPAQC